MLKKLFLAMMALAVMGLGFVACSDDDDDDEEEASVAESVAGSYTVNEVYTVYASTDTDFATSLGHKDASSVTVSIEEVLGSSDKVNITLPGIQYTGAMTVYSFKIENVAVATSDNENYTFTLGMFTSSARKDDGSTVAITGTSVAGTLVKSTKALTLKAVYQQGAMPLNGVDDFTPVSSASASIVSPSYSLSALNSASDYYGTWNGTWTVLGVGFDTTVIVGAGTFAYSSTMMSGSYEYVAWGTDSDGNDVCYGSHNSGEANASQCAARMTFKNGYGYFWVRAMSAFSSEAPLSKL